MSSAKRNIFVALLAIVVLAAAALYYLTSNLNGIVAGLIEEQGSAATQTSVTVSGVDIKLREASAALSGLSVANPEGFPGKALELGGFSVKLDAGSLRDDTIVVNDITVDGARINVLQQGGSNNLQELMSNLQGEATEEAPASEGGGKKIIIDQFTLSGASASVSIAELNETREVKLPTIVVRDIGRGTNGATSAQIAREILKPIIEKAISSATAASVKEAAGKKIGDAVGGFIKGIGKKE